MTGFICLRIIYDSMTNIFICLRVIICNHIASFSYRSTHLQLSQLTNVCTCHYTRRLVQCGKSTSIYLHLQCSFLRWYHYSYTSAKSSKYWPLIQSIHLPLQSRLNAFCGSIAACVSRCKKLSSHVVQATSLCGVTSTPIKSFLCLSTFAWRHTCIVTTFCTGLPFA